MNSISIAQTKALREKLGLTQLIIVGIDDITGYTYVNTSGKTGLDANEAAELGNKIKVMLYFPKDMCNDKPLQRICKNCHFYEGDYCNVEPVRVMRRFDRIGCRHFEPNC